VRQFLLKISLYFGVIAAFLAAAYAVNFHRHPAWQNYYAASGDKERILLNTAAPRLIAIGGSSVAFGIDAELIGQHCGLSPVNMGVHVSFGLSFMLSQVQAHLRRGDVVLLALEYNCFAQFYRADPELIATIVERNPLFVRQLPHAEAKAVLDRGLLMRVGHILRALCAGASDKLTLSDETYYRGAFNEHGDLISYLGKSGAGPDGTRFLYRNGSAQEAIERLNEFHRFCLKHGVRVFLSHPPFSKVIFRQSERAIRQLDAELKQTLTIPYLDAPEEAVFPDGDFFDTAYHLNEEGRRKRSLKIVERLVARGVTASTAFR